MGMTVRAKAKAPKNTKPSQQTIGDFWSAELGHIGPVEVPLPFDAEPRAFSLRRRRREKALRLIQKYSGLYAAEAAPEWVIKCVMNIDRLYWKQLEHTITEVEGLRKHLEGLKKDAEEPLRKALRQVHEFQRMGKENEELRATLAVAEATAAAATAELMQTRSGLTRLQSSRAIKAHRLREGYTQARREVRIQRTEGKGKELTLARTQVKNQQLEADVAELRAQLDTMSLHYEQQRALMATKVASTTEEFKPKVKKCKWCGPRVCAQPVTNNARISSGGS